MSVYFLCSPSVVICGPLEYVMAGIIGKHFKIGKSRTVPSVLYFQNLQTLLTNPESHRVFIGFVSTVGFYLYIPLQYHISLFPGFIFSVPITAALSTIPVFPDFYLPGFTERPETDDITR